jgi:hypothetical protein
VLGVAVPLFAALEEDWQYAVLGVAAVLVVRLSPIWALVGGALAGLVAVLAGLPVR